MTFSAKCHALSKQSDILAERVRFELTSPLRGCRFSRPVHSTALPPLRDHRYQLLALYCALHPTAFQGPMFPFRFHVAPLVAPGISGARPLPRDRVRVGGEGNAHVRVTECEMGTRALQLGVRSLHSRVQFTDLGVRIRHTGLLDQNGTASAPTQWHPGARAALSKRPLQNFTGNEA